MKKTRISSLVLAALLVVAAADAVWAHGYHHGPHARVIISTPGYHIFHPGWHHPFGRVDVEVEPREAQVFVDGNFVGTAGKLDGWPGYLYLRQGTYEITLVHPGYETITHTVAIFPRQRMTLDLPLVPGESTPGESTPGESTPPPTAKARGPDGAEDIEGEPEEP